VGLFGLDQYHCEWPILRFWLERRRWWGWGKKQDRGFTRGVAGLVFKSNLPVGVWAGGPVVWVWRDRTGWSCRYNGTHQFIILVLQRSELLRLLPKASHGAPVSAPQRPQLQAARIRTIHRLIAIVCVYKISVIASNRRVPSHMYGA